MRRAGEADHVNMNTNDSVLITGASKGLGFALATQFARRGHRLIINARREHELRAAERELARLTNVTAIAGDVSEIAEEIAAKAVRVDVLINNASELGPSPMPLLIEHPWDSLLRIFRVNVVAAIHLIQLLRPRVVVNITSDAGTNAYPHWGGYGASKAALDHASRVLAAEMPEMRVLVVDPGDMNTEMHALAEPGVDLSHLPSPDEVAPRIIAMLDERAERVA